jgi:hypothetical protein
MINISERVKGVSEAKQYDCINTMQTQIMLLFVAECVHDIQVTKTCWHTNEYHTI